MRYFVVFFNVYKTSVLVSEDFPKLFNVHASYDRRFLGHHVEWRICWKEATLVAHTIAHTLVAHWLIEENIGCALPATDIKLSPYLWPSTHCAACGSLLLQYKLLKGGSSVQWIHVGILWANLRQSSWLMLDNHLSSKCIHLKVDLSIALVSSVGSSLR